MTDALDIKLPPGMRLQTNPDGTTEVVRTALLTKVIAFRATPEDAAALLPFFDSFPSGRQTDALRWLLSQPAVVEVMQERVRSATRPG